MKKFFNLLKPFFGEGPYLFLDENEEIYNTLLRYVDAEKLKIKFHKRFTLDYPEKYFTVSLAIDNCLPLIDDYGVEKVTKDLLIVVNIPTYDKSSNFFFSPVLTNSINGAVVEEDGIEDIKIFGTAEFRDKYRVLFNES